MKRKAIFLESEYFSHVPSSPPSMTFSSTTSSPDSMSTEPFHSNLSSALSNYHLLPATNAPWLHSRTRKRVRDNRPEESQIHTDTVRKLFDAQRLQGTEDAMMLDDEMDCPSASMQNVEMFDSSDNENDHSSIHTPQKTYSLYTDTVEANQRSLHDFFQRRPQPPAAPSEPQHNMHVRSHSATALSYLTTSRSPTPQEISAGAPAPVVILRARASMGVLGCINAPSPEREISEMEAILSSGSAPAGGFLPCDFRSKVEEVASLSMQMQMPTQLQRETQMVDMTGGDAMVMG